MSNQPLQHFEETLEKDIGRIQQNILTMAKLDEQALEMALKSLVERDPQTAYSVILMDQKIDEMDNQLDRLCMEFIVKQQPVAGHLRFVYTAIQINRLLERIGDYAENIARKALILGNLEFRPSYDQFIELAGLSTRMLRESVQAFVKRDIELAERTMQNENLADQVRYKINLELLNLSQKASLPLKAMTALMTVARCYERVTDQAKHICEEVIYMATGETVKHRPTDTIRILFLEETNTCLSQMAEGIGKSLKTGMLSFSSAGFKEGKMDPKMVKYMTSRGMDMTGHYVKLIDSVPDFFDTEVIITFSRRQNSQIHRTSSKTVTIEWPLKNPSRYKKTEGIHKAYADSYAKLEKQIGDLVKAIMNVRGGSGKANPKQSSSQPENRN